MYPLSVNRESVISDKRAIANRQEPPNNDGPMEDAIDQILADSFPASDAPPWTLGVRDNRADLPHQRKESDR
jgi:hypothetical protein